MPRCELDHIVIVAPTLAAGAAWVERALGVAPRPGGAHARMGTHNMLLRLGAQCYLEIIAIDPAVPPPGRPRWFGMDERSGRTGCGPITWVARTDDIDAMKALSPEPLGEILPMSRGALHWRISVPPDGGLREGGVLPTLIQWESAPHPAHSLPDDGLRLTSVILRHPDPARCRAMLEALRCEGPFELEPVPPGMPPHVEACVTTSKGIARLRMD